MAVLSCVLSDFSLASGPAWMLLLAANLLGQVHQVCGAWEMASVSLPPAPQVAEASGGEETQEGPLRVW